MRSDNERSREKKYFRQKEAEKPKNNNRFKHRQQNRHKIAQQLPKLNRTQICPFLAQVYYCINGANYYQSGKQLPNEMKQRKLDLYLWMDSTLKQITEILRAYLPAVRTKQRFVFYKVSVEGNQYLKKQMGTVLVHKKGNDMQDIRLDSQNFFIGDYIDVSINYK